MYSNNLIITRILTLIEDEHAEEQNIIALLESEFKIVGDEAEDILELVKTGIFRARLNASGHKYPFNNLDNHSIVSATQKIWLKKYQPKHKKWWQFWKVN